MSNANATEPSDNHNISLSNPPLSHSFPSPPPSNSNAKEVKCSKYRS